MLESRREWDWDARRCSIHPPRGTHGGTDTDTGTGTGTGMGMGTDAGTGTAMCMGTDTDMDIDIDIGIEREGKTLGILSRRTKLFGRSPKSGVCESHGRVGELQHKTPNLSKSAFSG